MAYTLTLNEVARILRKSPKTVKRRPIPFSRNGNSRLYDPVDVEAYLSRQRECPSSNATATIDDHGEIILKIGNEFGWSQTPLTSAQALALACQLSRKATTMTKEHEDEWGASVRPVDGLVVLHVGTKTSGASVCLTPVQAHELALELTNCVPPELVSNDEWNDTLTENAWKLYAVSRQSRK